MKDGRSMSAMALDAQRNWNASMASSCQRMRVRSTVAADADAAPPSAPVRTFAPPSRPAPHLPVEILLKIVSHLARLDNAQRSLHACSLISRAWSVASTPALYAHPYIYGPNYDLFTRTICPSINIGVRRSPLSALVKDLDLSLLVHQGSKSVTARLLGRTKGSLERFVAPVASMGLNCFPALAKCGLLRELDLSLVSEATSLATLFDTVAGLKRLEGLRLPRSAGFGMEIDPAAIQWPVGLRRLVLSGGLDGNFWKGNLRLPEGIEEVCITHCPKLEHEGVMMFLHTLSGLGLKRLQRLEFANLPLLHDVSLNQVLGYLPHLPSLSVAVDYASPEMLNPFGVARSAIAQGTAYDPEQHGPILGLRTLELTDSGDVADPEKFMPMDIHIVADDYRTIPNLETVIVVPSLTAWFTIEEEVCLDMLHDMLVDCAKARGTYDSELVGVKKRTWRSRR